MAETLDVGTLDEAGTEALERLIITLADTKRLLGIRYSDWILGAPSVETGIAASSMCQDEWGHARLLYSMFKSFGKDPIPLEHDRPASDYANVAALDEEMPDWAAVVALMVLVDGALCAMLTSFAGGTFEPARSRVPKMLAEEEFHESLGAAWYRRLAKTQGEASELLKAATERMLPGVLAWLGTDDEGYTTMVEAGVIEDARTRTARFTETVGAMTALVGIDVQEVDATSDWDGRRARTLGQPNDESIERARGDRNRALFVE